MTYHVKSQTTLPHIKRSSALLMRYCLLVSLALHIGCIAIVLLMQLLPSADLNGTPQELVIPIFLVPLSALETNLPQRVVQEQKSLPAPTQVPTHSATQRAPHIALKPLLQLMEIHLSPLVLAIRIWLLP